MISLAATRPKKEGLPDWRRIGHDFPHDRLFGDHACYSVAPSGSIRIHSPSAFSASFVRNSPSSRLSDWRYNIQMESDSSHGTKRRMALLGNYVERHRCGECGNRAVPIFDGNGEASKHGEAPRALLDCMRLAGDKTGNAGGPLGIPNKTAPKCGVRYVEPTARRPKESDMEGDRRSIGILHGRMGADVLGGRKEVGDRGPPSLRAHPPDYNEGKARYDLQSTR